MQAALEAANPPVGSGTGSSLKRGEEMAAIECLGDDVLCLLLGRLRTRHMLQSAALVCKRWHQLCMGLVRDLGPPRFLARLPASKSSVWLHLSGDEAAQIVERHAAALESLNLRYLGTAAKRHNDHRQSLSALLGAGGACLRLLPQLPRLRSLVVPALELGRTLDLAALRPRLTDLRFTFDRGDYKDPTTLPDCAWCWLDDAALRTISERCPHLERVAFGMCQARIRTLNTRRFLASLSPALKSVSIQYGEVAELTALDDDALWFWEDVAFILRTCLKLESLELQGPVFSGLFRDASFSNYPPNIPTLVFPPALNTLRLLARYRHGVNRTAFYAGELLRPAFAEKGHQFQEFYFQGVDIESIPCTPNLTTLDMGNAYWLRSGSVRFSKREAGNLLTKLRMLPKLERLALADATDEMLVAVGLHCPRLKEIHIHGPEFDDMLPAVHLPKHPRVEEITNRGVIALAEGCPLLRVVNVGHSVVTLGAVRALAFHCRELEVLFLTGCLPTKKLPGIEDDAVSALLPRLASQLRLLDLAGTGITDKALKALYGRAQEPPFPMRVLVLPSRPAIRDSTWAKKLQKVPNLDVRFGSSGLHWNGLHKSPLLED